MVTIKFINVNGKGQMTVKDSRKWFLVSSTEKKYEKD